MFSVTEGRRQKARGRRQEAEGNRQKAEGSLDETSFITKYESETGIFTQHSARAKRPATANSTQHFQVRRQKK
ncbi:hypothetical protein [Nostoc sp. FACHB-110]|uniref:hypothetical protein n=1 Tax=Nostoc sp. FACHB-110 TaxID=2692834 RepID=UPI001687A417|nr:hypothetical protein [Nostoc sp. FACHB-110]MBD2438179.1 hypothetical protein [Nostoc sp. FACHB-110]